MRIVVFGRGFLGNRLASSLAGARLAPTDICDREGVLTAVRLLHPDVVINAAGKTGSPNVDWAENHQWETYRSNVIGALTLADVCATERVHLIHLGSGCVFYGPSPHPDGAWREDDHANPQSYYSKTKWAADLCLSSLPDACVVRLRMPIDHAPHRRNLIYKLTSFRQVVDVENSVTVVDDLIDVIAQLAERRATGIFHATNPGTISHRRILKMYREIADPSHHCEFIPEGDLVRRGLVAAPRSNCALASTRLEAVGLAMRPIELALPATLKQYAAARSAH